MGKSNKYKSRLQTNHKATDGTKLNSQLGALGLRIAHVTADGNCLFRAVADQLEGDEEEHLKYRKMVVDYIEKHQKDFEPFIEDEVPFNEYCKIMRQPGTWAGHMELQAISLVTHANICIHRLSSPRWHILNFKNTEIGCIHLSYHNDEHYNSVRSKNDDGDGQAKLIIIESPEKEKRNSLQKRAREGHLNKDARTSHTKESVLQMDNTLCKRGFDDCEEDEVEEKLLTESWTTGKVEGVYDDGGTNAKENPNSSACTNQVAPTCEEVESTRLQRIE